MDTNTEDLIADAPELDEAPADDEVRVRRTASILEVDHNAQNDGSIRFHHEDGRMVVCLSRQLFAELGRPETITVTVELGDTLNVGE